MVIVTKWACIFWINPFMFTFTIFLSLIQKKKKLININISLSHFFFLYQKKNDENKLYQTWRLVFTFVMYKRYSVIKTTKIWICKQNDKYYLITQHPDKCKIIWFKPRNIIWTMSIWVRFYGFYKIIFH